MYTLECISRDLLREREILQQRIALEIPKLMAEKEQLHKEVIDNQMYNEAVLEEMKSAARINTDEKSQVLDITKSRPGSAALQNRPNIASTVKPAF